MLKPHKPLLTAAAALLLALGVAGCKDDTPGEVPKAQAEAPRVCSNCGTVSSIEEVTTKGKGSGIGAVTGAVIGGVIGHQIGGGRGKDVATVAGAAGGAYAGHESEKRYNATTSYRVVVSMESGGTRTVNVEHLNGVGVGSKVKVSGNGVQLI